MVNTLRPEGAVAIATLIENDTGVALQWKISGGLTMYANRNRIILMAEVLDISTSAADALLASRPPFVSFRWLITLFARALKRCLFYKH